MTAVTVATPAVEALVQRMCREYDVAPERIREHVISIYAEFADARVQTFVPVLVERRLRDQLRRQEQALPAAQPAMTG